MLMFNHSSCLCDESSLAWTYVILDNNNVSLISLLFFLLRSWNFCLSLNTIMLTSWKSNFLIWTTTCMKRSYIFGLFLVQASWSFCSSIVYIDELSLASRIIENEDLILLEVLYFVLQLFSQRWSLRQRDKDCHEFDLYFSR